MYEKRLNLLFNSKKSNPVWDYFQLDGDKAICRLCNKRLAYKNHMYLTSLSNHLASKRYGHRQHYMEYVTKKNELIRETDMFNNIILKMGNRTFDSSDFYNFKYMYKNFICDKWVCQIPPLPPLPTSHSPFLFPLFFSISISLIIIIFWFRVNL